MGYRSEVVLAIAPEAASAFMALCAKSPKVMELCHDANVFHSGYSREGDWLIHWSDIKWYNETYEPIGAIQSFVDNCDADTLESWTTETEEKLGRVSDHFRFLRIGEEWDDVEN